MLLEKQKRSLKRVIKKEKEKNSKTNTLCQDLILLLKAFGSFAQGEYTISFVLGWIIIERWINHLWNDLLWEKSISGNRKSRLTGIKWEIHHKLETLNLVGKLNNSDYEMLNKFREIRNNILHKGENVKKDDAKKCLEFAYKIVVKTFNDKISDNT